VREYRSSVVPILDRNPDRCFNQFAAHMDKVVRSVIPLPPAVTLSYVWRRDTDEGVLEFTGGGSVATTVPVQTDLGELHLSLNQGLVAIR
jgi:hypothetical protein